MDRVYLIPIDHRVQEDGRLKDLYEELKPRVILSEGSDEVHGKLERICLDLQASAKAAGFQKARELADIFRYLTNQFPVNTNLEYARFKGLTHEFISDYDPNQLQSFQHVSEMAEGMIRIIKQGGNMQELLTVLEACWTDRSIFNADVNSYWNEYLKIERSIKYELTLLRLKLQGYVGRSDSIMEQKIRYHFSLGGNLVFPVGMVHVTDSLIGLTLYSRIKNLNPVRLKL